MWKIIFKQKRSLNMHYSKITDATLNNLIRKSSYIDNVSILDNTPLFSWIDINITELCNRKCVFCPKSNDDVAPDTYQMMNRAIIDKIHDQLKEIEFNDTIRKSAHTFNIVNNKLQVFPLPTGVYKLWFEYIVKLSLIHI